MAGADAASADGRPRVGRPPRINRQMIAEAAHELGLDGLTLRDVADHLGVSIAALYHHVSSKDDLMRLAAEHSAAQAPLPDDRDQHWAVWLYEWAVYNRDVFLAQPGLLAQYLDGAISPDAIAGNVDAILGLLVRQGFDVLAANEAYELVSSCALGTAVATIREREADEAGRPIASGLQEALVRRAPDELPHLRALLAAVAARGRPPFHERVATVLCGIA
ncbi:MAG TPA: helix-turn-helix domain-containing protein, partial [Acidimicrobiales bacterium]